MCCSNINDINNISVEYSFPFAFIAYEYLYDDSNISSNGSSTINTTNVYTNIGQNNTSVFTRSLASSVALCDPGDTALSGSFKVGQVGTPPPGSLPAIPLLISSKPLTSETGWNITVFGINSGNGHVTADVECFDNPPLH